jgi:hypothetical protein
MARECLANLFFIGIGMFCQEGDHRHEDTGSAESALETVRFPEGFLDRMKLICLGGEPLDRGDDTTVGLDGEHETGAHGGAVDKYGACTTDTMLTTYVGPSEANLVPEEVAQKKPRFNLTLMPKTVDRDADRDGCAHSHLPRWSLGNRLR